VPAADIQRVQPPGAAVAPDGYGREAACSINLSKAIGGSESIEGMLAWLFMPLVGVSTLPGVETWGRPDKGGAGGSDAGTIWR
jgi:hypothetical protein